MRIFSNGRLPVLAVALATLVGCSQDARLSSALLVNVTVDSSSQAQCVRVLVRPTTGAEQDTDGLARKDELRVAVYRGEGWSNDVTVLARGYVDCGKPVDQFIEESAPKAASFPGSGTELVSLVLKAAEDVDHDGFKSPEDCDDHDATVHPGANELCTDTVDKNCSGTTGCADLACVGPCGQNGQGACSQGVCKATTEVDCTDGQDNDSDFLTDCNDPDCRGVSCNDGSACTSGETCQSNGQCGGPTSTVSCNNSPGQCFESVGTCNPLDAGCSYSPTTGSCDDGNACTLGETCRSDGGCGAPTGNVACNSPPGVCFDSAGTCIPADGGCDYAIRSGSCADNDLCTSGETCNSAGACVPTFTQVCNTPPGQCYESTGACELDGGCSYAITTGSCDDQNPCTLGETCQSDGTCGAPTGAVTCDTPPAGGCFAPVGACNVQDGGCQYAVLTASSCDDGNACTSGETCQANGSCGAPTTTKQCTTQPDQCHAATGSCDSTTGACSYAVLTGGTCDDGDKCTTGETCQSDGSCGAPTSTVSCGPSPGQCFAAGSCNPVDGTCSFPVQLGLACDDNDKCTGGTKCQADGGCGNASASIACLNPPGQCFVSRGQCNPANGQCSYAVDAGASCNDQSACTSGESCQLDGGCGAPTSTVSCATAPGQCFSDAGTCDPANGSCSYPVISGTCNDGNACTTGDVCQTDGGCAGPAPVTCSVANQCFDAGTCAPASGCPSPQPMVGAACSDGNTCTLGESCDTSGNCGTPTSTTTCTPNECQTSGSCLADAGCSFTNKANGTACTGGTCVSGSCLTLTSFTYTPSNFTPDQSKVLGPLTINCSLTFNTDGANPSFTTCPGTNETVTPQVITQKNSTTLEAVVLHVSSLSVTSAGTLTVTGGRPLIIAVYGAADVSGTIDVSGSATTAGPGADQTCVPPTAPATINGTMTGTNGGSGAGGGGNAGVGGNGGAATGNPATGSGGLASSNGAAITPLAGGCKGGTGGSSNTGPAGGGGGGAVQISSSGAFHVSGNIYASGGGGRGGTVIAASHGEGGSGGGSAGSILLEGASMSLANTLKLTANGGGGGEGANNAATNGNNGNDGPKGTNGVAAGGNGASLPGGNGGAGGAGNVQATAGGAGNTGGGGGGGGGAYGRIRLNSSTPICRVTGGSPVISPSNGNAINTPAAAPGFTSNTTINSLATCP